MVCRPLETLGVVNAFSTRVGGVSPLPEQALNLGRFSRDRTANVSENRRRFLLAIGWPNDHLLTMRQIHSAECQLIEDGAAALHEPPPCDAMISQRTGVLLGVQTADCLPILIYDPERRAVAAIHAGWRGTLKGIVPRALDQMKERFGTEASDCYVAIGPAIQQCCYEVGRDVTDPFYKTFSFAAEVMRPGPLPDKTYLDLAGTTLRLLEATGVNRSNIFISEDCTACRNDLFFSYRREKETGYGVGRLLAVIGLPDA